MRTKGLERTVASPGATEYLSDDVGSLRVLVLTFSLFAGCVQSRTLLNGGVGGRGGFGAGGTAGAVRSGAGDDSGGSSTVPEGGAGGAPRAPFAGEAGEGGAAGGESGSSQGGCAAACAETTCGNGQVEITETCDDGNRHDGDGCHHDCLLESGFSCEGEPSVCSDVDECALGSDTCAQNTVCKNVVGGYECGSCLPGYVGTGAEGCVPGVVLAAGDDFNCALLAEGGITCWGDDSDGQVTGAPATGEFLSVAAGSRHACAIKSDNTLACWGSNKLYQAPPEAGDPVKYGRFKSIACGDDFTCGIRLDGSSLCFGDASGGKLKDPPGDYQLVAARAGNGCALTTLGTIVCWGDDQWGITASPKGMTFAALAVGPEHACAITSTGEMSCWGSDSAPNGAGLTRTQAPPYDYLAVSLGLTFTATITAGDHFICFGSPLDGECTTNASILGTWRAVAAGTAHTCLLGAPDDQSSDTVVCFGNNDFGQLDAPSARFKSY